MDAFGIAHRGGGDETAFEDEAGLDAEKAGFQSTRSAHFADFDGPNLG